MGDVISRDTMRGKLIRMADRIKQRKAGSYRCGYSDACKDAMQKLDECPPLAVGIIVRCRDCVHADERFSTMPYCMIQNRRKMPDNYCEMGESEVSER